MLLLFLFLGKLNNNIDILLSHECNNVINKLNQLSDNLKSNEVIKLAVELKENITHATMQTCSGNVNNSKRNIANLVLKLQNAISVTQAVIYEESQNLLTEFEKVDLEYINNVLANLSLTLGSISSPEGVTQQIVTQGEIMALGLDETAVNNDHEEILAEIASSISTSAHQLNTQKSKSVETCSKNVEKREISPAAREIANHLVQNDNLEEQIVISDNNKCIEPKDVPLILDSEKIRDSQQLSSGNDFAFHNF